MYIEYPFQEHLFGPFEINATSLCNHKVKLAENQ